MSQNIGKPEPMDTGSGYTNFKNFNRQGKMDTNSAHTNFKSSAMTRNTNQAPRSQQSKYSHPNMGQMHHVNTEDDPEDRLEHSQPQNDTEDMCNIEDSENFCTPAWPDQQDT